MILGRWAPALLAGSGAALVAVGGRSWAEDLPVIAAAGWATAAAGLLAWFVSSWLRRLVAVVALILLASASIVALSNWAGWWSAAAALAAVVGVAAAAVLLLSPVDRRDRPRQGPIDPWAALDRGEDPTAGPPT